MDRNTFPTDAGNPAWRLGRRAAVWLLLAAAAAATATVIVTRPMAAHSASAAATGGAVAPGPIATLPEPRLAERLDHSVVERTGTSEPQDSTGASVAAYGP